MQSAIARQNDILVITEASPIDEPEGPRIVYVNEAFERRTGYTREEVMGRTPRLLQGPSTQRTELDRIRIEYNTIRMSSPGAHRTSTASKASGAMPSGDYRSSTAFPSTRSICT